MTLGAIRGSKRTTTLVAPLYSSLNSCSSSSHRTTICKDRTINTSRQESSPKHIGATLGPAALPFCLVRVGGIALRLALWIAVALADVELPAPLDQLGVVKGFLEKYLRWRAQHTQCSYHPLALVDYNVMRTLVSSDSTGLMTATKEHVNATISTAEIHALKRRHVGLSHCGPYYMNDDPSATDCLSPPKAKEVSPTMSIE